MLDAQQDLYEAQDKQVGRDRDTFLALISVYKAMGGGWMVAQEQSHAAAAATDTQAKQAQAQAEGAQASSETRRDSSK